MFKKLQTIYQLKKIRQREINNDFLASLKIDLVDFIKNNPAMIDAPSFSLAPFNLFQPKYAMALIVIIITVFGGGGMAFASQGSLPGEKLYPLKALTEDVRLALTRSPEAKERFAINLAAKRISEIKAIMEKKNGDSAGLNVAVSRLEKNMKITNNTIDKERGRGRDVTIMANSANESFSFQEKELEKIFKTQKDKLANQMKILGDKIELEKTTGTSTETEILTKQLENLRIKTGEIITAKEKAVKKIIEQKEQTREKIEKDRQPKVNFNKKPEKIGEDESEKRENRRR